MTLDEVGTVRAVELIERPDGTYLFPTYRSAATFNEPTCRRVVGPGASVVGSSCQRVRGHEGRCSGVATWNSYVVLRKTGNGVELDARDQHQGYRLMLDPESVDALLRALGTVLA